MAKVIGIGADTRQDQTDLRPDLRLRLAAPQGGRRGAARHHDLRPGEGRRHLGAGADEHDPARPPDRRDLARQHPRRTHFKDEDGSLKTFDFAVANPPFSAKAWSNGLDPENDESAASSTASRRPRTATTPSSCTSSRRSRARARARSSCRTACCSAATRRPTSAGT